MSEPKQVITRRDFMRTGSRVMAGSLFGLPLLCSVSHAGAKEKSRVILIRDEKVCAHNGPARYERMAQMLDQAVAVLLDKSKPASAWQQLFQSSDIVGIKSNVWGPLPTPWELEHVIQKRLTGLGVKEKNISTDDRGVRRNPIFKKATALINIRPMRSHHWSGLGTLLKNYIMFSAAPWSLHANACERLGGVWQKYNLRPKTRLNILVMLTPLFHGIGPHHFSRRYTWPYGGLIVSRDPVAADATGAQIMQAKRNQYFGKNKPISPRPLHIQAAERQFRLGTSHPDRIELIKMGWDKDLFI